MQPGPLFPGQVSATVVASKYGEEEYILLYKGHEYLMEVKGVSKSISLRHLRQLTDYLLKYEEDTGKDGKGILFGNSWRNLPIEERGKTNTPEFPQNVIKRATNLDISLVSSKSFFQEFIKTMDSPELSDHLLEKITSSHGVVLGTAK